MEGKKIDGTYKLHERMRFLVTNLSLFSFLEMIIEQKNISTHFSLLFQPITAAQIWLMMLWITVCCYEKYTWYVSVFFGLWTSYSFNNKITQLTIPFYFMKW